MGIIIGGDFVPTESNLNCFINGDYRGFIGERLLMIIRNADYRIFNLEMPLTDNMNPIEKAGPNLVAPAKAVNGYSSINVDMLTLANNHILDQGAKGLEDTETALKDVGIHFAGTGHNLKEASAPFVFSMWNKTIGVYACAEREFSIASERECGANPFDPLDSLDHIFDLKKKCDFVIVLYHGGKEHYPYPSPNLKKRCEKMVLKGADLVICQHSHCIGCIEEYDEGTIVYGQGNFLFGRSEINSWNEGLVIELNPDFSISYIPITVDKEGKCVDVADIEETERILNTINQRSEEIKSNRFVEEQYAIFAKSMVDYYLKAFSGKESILFKVLNKISGNRIRQFKLNKMYTKHTRTVIRNYIECEAHHELVIEALKRNYFKY